MWLFRFSNYILLHRYKALLLTFLIAFVPMVGTVAILIAAFITLVKGTIEGAIFTVVATLPYVISFFFSITPGQPIPLALWVAISVAVMSNALTWVFATMLHRQINWSSILELAALFGVFVISILHLLYPNLADWWGTQLQSYYAQGANFLKGTRIGTPEIQSEIISRTKQYATGLMVAAILFNGILQLIIARWWQGIIFMPGKLGKELHEIRLGQLAGVLFIISLVFSYLGNRVVLDIMPVPYLLFAGAGLSLVHYLFGMMHSSTVWFWLILFYFVVIISFPSSVIILSFIGLLDIWLDVRSRIKKVI